MAHHKCMYSIWSVTYVHTFNSTSTCTVHNTHTCPSHMNTVCHICTVNSMTICTVHSTYSHTYTYSTWCVHIRMHSTEWSHLRTKNHQSIVSASQLTIDGGQREFGLCVMCCHGNNMVVRHCSCFKVIQTVQAFGMLQPDPSLWAWEQIIE